MKTTFKQYLQEAGSLPLATSVDDLLSSIKDGKLTKDGSHLDVTGTFNCSSFSLTSIKGVPSTVGGDFYCYDNKLTSLEGAPETVLGDIACNSNGLVSLEGSPKIAGGYFRCTNNKLTSLEGAPKTVNSYFDCTNNKLTSLVGAPTKTGGYFSCSNNKLTSLEGAPQYIGGFFYCDENNLSSLKDIHKQILQINAGANFKDNPIKSHVLGLLKIKNLDTVVFDNAELEIIINKYLPEGDIFACQQELIDNGLEEYAQL